MIWRLLYKNMVDAKADWLYELPQWNNIFSGREEKRTVQGAEEIRNCCKRTEDRPE